MNTKKLFKSEDLTAEARAMTEDQNIATEDLGASLDLNAPVSTHIHSMTKKDWIDQAKDDYLNCPMCATELLFTHVTQFVDLETTEEAYCPSCRVRTRTTSHRLQ